MGLVRVTVKEPSFGNDRERVVFRPRVSSIEKDPVHGLLALMESV